MTKNSVLAADDDEEVTTLPTRRRGVKAQEAVEKDAVVPKGGKRVRIILEENDNIPPTGQFISVNGRAYMLRPGEEADVPEEILHVLNDAVQDVPQLDVQSQQIIGYRKKLRFPYRIIARDV